MRRQFGKAAVRAGSDVALSEKSAEVAVMSESFVPEVGDANLLRFSPDVLPLHY